MVLINLKLVARDWKKIVFIAFLITLAFFISDTLSSDEKNIVSFFGILFGFFIALSAIWTGIIAVWGFIISLNLLIKQKNQSKNKNDSHNSTQ